jgi:hypothetical protein
VQNETYRIYVCKEYLGPGRDKSGDGRYVRNERRRTRDEFTDNERVKGRAEAVPAINAGERDIPCGGRLRGCERRRQGWGWMRRRGHIDTRVGEAYALRAVVSCFTEIRRCGTACAA